MHLKTLADRAHLLRAWRSWHVEPLEEALADVYADVMSRLMAQLEELRSARALVDFIAAQDWESVDAEMRAIALFEINRAITALRERQKLPPINDALPGEPLTAFQIIRGIIISFPHSGEARRSIRQIVECRKCQKN